ncbi:MAG: Trk system potassium transporter TrkA [Clostridia bacterium]|nr:Trk system potassium transporter TrkA [Clostridia bacterium]
MNIIIIGCGKTGEELVASLLAENHNISIIDTLPSVINAVQESYDVIGICGSGAVTDILREAGVEKADLVISCTPQDELNVLSCTIAKRLGAKNCVARVRNPDLHAQIQFMRREFGIDNMFNPEYHAANAISRILRIPSAIKVDSFASGRIDIVELKVTEKSPLAGLSLMQFPSKFKTRVLVCTVQCAGSDRVLVPSGAYVIKPGDILNLTATHGDIHRFFREIGELSEPIRDVMLIGGSRIAYYLTKMLTDSGMRVKIIESDENRCLELARELPKAQIIHGDGSDHELLVEEGIRNMDACIPLTGMDESNMILSLYALSEGVQKVIPKINKKTLLGMAGGIQLNSGISPNQLMANVIISYARALGQSGNSAIRTLYKLIDGQVEAMEFVATDKAEVIGTPLCDLKLKKNLLIAGIVRGSHIIYPGANDVICPGDIVIVVTTNLYISSLDGILEE